MKVLLVKDVASLGKAGELKEVKDGYGQNFLIAKGLAKLATNEVINKYKAEQKKQEQLEALEIAQLKQIAQKLGEITLVISKKIGANKHLFGSITKDEISNALDSNHKIKIDKKAFEIPAIKELGTFEIGVKLPHGIHSTLKVQVIKE